MQESMIAQNIIIKEPSKRLRSLGRNTLEDKWKGAIITVIVYLLLTEIPPIIFNALFGTNVFSPFLQNGNTYGLDVDIYAEIYNSMPKLCALSSIYIILVTGALELGMTLYFLAVFRSHDVAVTDVFLGFEKFGKALGLYLFQTLFITLWTLLFIVPGIIAAIRYSQAFFILADDPTKSIRQCMNESKLMMKGNKSKYFCLSISFIGWLLLCTIPSGILQSIGEIISTNDVITSLFSVIGGLCLAPVIAYIYSTMAGFYEILAGHLIKETRPVPVTVQEAQELHAELQAEAKAKDDEEKEVQPETADEDDETDNVVEKDKTDEEDNSETQALLNAFESAIEDNDVNKNKDEEKND